MDILSIKSKNIFMYIIIIICTYLYFKKINIQINIILGLLVALFIIYIFNEKETSIAKIYENNVKEKRNILRPKSVILENKKDMLDFLFSIQELYAYNPKSYEEMIINLNNFFDCYEEAKKNTPKASEKFNDMQLIRRNSLNALHSIIFSLPPAHNNGLLQKISDALNKLMELLNYYMSNVYVIAKNEIKNNGYNSTTAIMVDSPYMQKNIYDTGTGKYSNIYSYQYF